jgi:endo-1,4-beta-xylanase
MAVLQFSVTAMNHPPVPRRFVVLMSLVLGISLVAGRLPAAEPDEIRLWPSGAPGSEGKTDPEKVRVTDAGDHVVSSVHQPSITPYLPDPSKANGAAVLVIPGGGHSALWMDHEGYNMAKVLQAHGTAAFVLKYRLARETNSTYTIAVHALADTQRALRLIRSRASEWHVDPARLGAVGFSAGGELVWLSSSHFDAGTSEAADPIERQPSRPSFLGFIYPGRSGDIQPSTNSPPAFLACAYDDRKDIAEGLAEVYLRFKRAGVPAELHIFSTGGHGFGLRAKNTRPVGRWMDRFEDWMADSGFLKAK